MSGNVTISVRGQDIQFKEDYLGDRKLDLPPPLGRVSWKMNSSMTGYKLIDSQGSKVASYSEDHELDIFVSDLNEFLIEAIVLSGIGVTKKSEKDTKDAVSAMKIIGHLAGA